MEAVYTEKYKIAAHYIYIPLHLIEDGNHSLETGDTKRDLNNLCQIMKLTESYMEQIESGEIK